MPFKHLLVSINVMLTVRLWTFQIKNKKCRWNMQKMNPSVDIKIILHHHLWELKFCLSFVGILFHFSQENIFFPELFFPFIAPFYFFIFSVLHQNTGKPTNMKQADKTSINKITLYKFIFHIYIQNILQL